MFSSLVSLVYVCYAFYISINLVLCKLVMYLDVVKLFLVISIVFFTDTYYFLNVAIIEPVIHKFCYYSLFLQSTYMPTEEAMAVPISSAMYRPNQPVYLVNLFGLFIGSQWNKTRRIMGCFLSGRTP